MNREESRLCGGTSPLAWDWGDVRPLVVHDLKRTELTLLEKRRPRLYQGIDVLDWKLHRKLLKSLTSYHAMTLLGVWTGCPMVGSHKKTVGLLQDPSCTCGHDIQDVYHLLFTCPTRPTQPRIEPLRHMPAVISCAVLRPLSHTRFIQRSWEAACLEIVSLISKMDLPSNLAGKRTSLSEFEKRGHELAVESTNRYVYCGRCHIARRITDAKYICVA